MLRRLSILQRSNLFQVRHFGRKKADILKTQKIKSKDEPSILLPDVLVDPYKMQLISNLKNDTSQFKKTQSRITLAKSLEREFQAEINEYKIDKTLLNLVTDMGYLIKDNKSNTLMSLIKKSDKHVVQINLRQRKRLIEGPKDLREKLMKENPDIVKQLEP